MSQYPPGQGGYPSGPQGYPGNGDHGQHGAGQPGYPNQSGYGPGLPATPPPSGPRNPQWQGAYRPDHGPGYGMPPMPVDVRPGIMALRPQSVGETLEVGFKGVFKTLHVSLLLPLLLMLVPAAFLAAAIVYFVRILDDINAEYTAGSDEFLALIFFVLAMLALAVASFVLVGACLHAFSEAVLGRRIGFFASLGAGLRAAPALLGASLLCGLLGVGVFAVPMIIAVFLSSAGENSSSDALALGFFLALLAMFVFMFYAGVKLSFISQAVVMERCGPLSALKRSWRLTKNRWWRVFGAVFLAGIVVNMLSWVLQVLVGATMGLTPMQATMMDFTASDSGVDVDPHAVTAMLVMLAVSMLATALLYPFTLYVTSACYLDARIRDENLAPTLIAASRQHSGPALAESGPYQTGAQPRGGYYPQ